MTASFPINTLFLDIGGVLLTNGWDHNIRKSAAEKFGLDYEEMNERHRLTFDTCELGKLSLDDYLKRVVFYQNASLI
jgi:putative hydrolase of the HAD superfamily